jgi:class 3 adenylate cyclase
VDIAAWLSELGLERYIGAFRDNDIDDRILHTLSADDLRELGVSSLGHRKKLLDAIARLRDAEPTVEMGSSGAPQPRSAAERRHLTVMFVDLVGSTELAGKLDPEDMREVLRAYQDACAGVIARFDGFVAKFMGDGVLAYFGYPRAHEDEAERAVRAGLALATTIGGLKAPNGEALGARIGIATGLVVVGDLVGEGAAQEQAVVGETPNFAARLQGIAAPGQVVIAGATRRLLGTRFELQDLGERELKGIGAPVQAYVIIGERPVESRFEAMSGPSVLPMVGRDQELALLLERWTQAKAGEGQGVLLVGEAGIGKSRIGRALLDAVTEEPHVRIRYQCSPYHIDSALWPVMQQLNYAAGLAANDPLEARLEKLEALLDLAGGRDAAPLIADLLGLDGSARYGPLDLTPQAQRVRTLDALVDQLVGLAAHQPVLVVLEDAHWIDPTTLEMIEQGLDRIAAARVLLLLTSRPDRQPALAAHPHVTRLTLNRLGRAGVEAIVARLGADHLPGATIDAIIARTDGVPLFVEELTKAVLESGETAIPASLHDSLMARLDRIPEIKEVAQIAACIGREFDYPLLAAVVDRTEPRPPVCTRPTRGLGAHLPSRSPARRQLCL